jgi:enamine deaminase RidA (YjgF/YER057c/UK114 family)
MAAVRFRTLTGHLNLRIIGNATSKPLLAFLNVATHWSGRANDRINLGWNAQRKFHADDFAGQVKQPLQNALAVLAQAEHIERMIWYVVD